jgi:hypothetical protein
MNAAETFMPHRPGSATGPTTQSVNMQTDIQQPKPSPVRCIRLVRRPDWMQPIRRPVKRECPKCGACGITEYQDRDAYGCEHGEIIPQRCPNCGEWLNQSHWGNVETRWEEVEVAQSSNGGADLQPPPKNQQP